MARKDGRFADILPSPEEQDRQIRVHESILQIALENTYQILTPPIIETQLDWPTRIFLTEPIQEVFINVPRKSKEFLLQNVYIHYPPDTINGLTGPTLTVMVAGADKLYMPNPGADVRNWTTPGTSSDPGTAGDLASYKSGLTFNVIFENLSELRVLIFGFDGTNPEWVDIALVGRCVNNRKVLDVF